KPPDFLIAQVYLEVHLLVRYCSMGRLLNTEKMVFEHHLFKIKKDCDTNFVTTFKCIPRAKKLSEEIQF
ncbi:hypothetical protein NNG62_02700, partial [Enterococcus faecium]|nr:hypothetical protein [Enterococcus faecium]